ncbi:MAG TPA: response regulator [Desulfobacterales bacterium]|nr:response regulator [Desulfobacterales bacterium]
MRAGKTILVVEDSQAVNAMVCRALELEGYKTCSAYNGEEGLTLTQAEEPDLIVMDLMMPVMDGFEATRRLKEDPATSSIPILVLTALDKVQHVIMALDVGADSFLNKPFNAKTLIDRIKKMFENQAMAGSVGTDAQKAIQQVGKVITISRTRRQMFEAVFHALQQAAPCDVFSVLICRPDSAPFFVTSERFIPEPVLEQFRAKVLRIADRVLPSPCPREALRTEMICTAGFGTSPAFIPPFRASVHVPFCLSDAVSGVLSIGSHDRYAYDEDDFKFLFDLGARIGPTLSKITI